MHRQRSRLFRLRLVVGGAPVDEPSATAAAERLARADPFLQAVGAARDRLEVTFHEESDTLDHARAIARELWGCWRAELDLPDWRVLDIHEVAPGEPVPGQLVPGQRSDSTRLGGPRTYRLG